MDAKLFAYLSYPDAPAALDWMERVGFHIVRRQDGCGVRFFTPKSASVMLCSWWRAMMRSISDLV